MHTVEQGYKAAIGLSPQVIASATTTNGTGVDCLELGYDCMAVLQLGTQTGTFTADVKIQESDASGSGYADISGASFTQADQDDDDAVAAITFRRTKRYIRVVDVTAGTVTAHNVAVSLLIEALKQGASVNSATPA